MVGEALVPYYRQILPILNIFKNKNREYSNTVKIDLSLAYNMSCNKFLCLFGHFLCSLTSPQYSGIGEGKTSFMAPQDCCNSHIEKSPMFGDFINATASRATCGRIANSTRECYIMKYNFQINTTDICITDSCFVKYGIVRFKSMHSFHQLPSFQYSGSTLRS